MNRNPCFSPFLIPTSIRSVAKPPTVLGQRDTPAVEMVAYNARNKVNSLSATRPICDPHKLTV
jgi:hypothetical protein